MKKRQRWLAGLLLVIVISLAVVVFQPQNEPTSSVFELPPPDPRPAVTDLAPTATIQNKRFNSLAYGLHTFLWWNQPQREWDLENLKVLNFHYVKQSFAWADIQPQRELWDWTFADAVVQEVAFRERRLVARIDSPPAWAVRPIDDWEDVPFDLEAFATYCGLLASRYEGQIEGYQIWNEPNLEREWAGNVPNAAAYVKMLAACAAAIREADPEAIIISAGLSPTGTRNHSALPDEEYLWEMYDAGAAAHFDVLGLHAPGYALPPEATAADAETCYNSTEMRWARFRHVEDMRAIMVANGDAHKQIAIMEMGWTTDNRPATESIYSWFGVTPNTQANYLVRAYAYAAANWRPWVGLITTIYLAKDTWTPDDEHWWWAINEPATPPEMRIRPAFLGLANMEKVSDNPAFAEPERDPNLRYVPEHPPCP